VIMKDTNIMNIGCFVQSVSETMPAFAGVGVEFETKK